MIITSDNCFNQKLQLFIIEILMEKQVCPLKILLFLIHIYSTPGKNYRISTFREGL